MTAAPSTQPSAAAASDQAGHEIDASCRAPLFVLFFGAASWLMVASVFALISSIKFHGPNFLANVDWLTYGRVRPAYLNSAIYGFCLQAALGVGLWFLARLGASRVVQPGIILVGACFWNCGVAVGVAGILAGDASGFPWLDMPIYGAVLAFIGYLLIGTWTVLTLHQRQHRNLYVSQWFFLTALFWFPWIYSTANLLLQVFPARGVAQAVIHWWFAGNLHVVWMGLAGLAVVLYFIPKLTGHMLHSRYLSLFTFWMLILFGSWVGIPASAPVPAWLPTISLIAVVMTVFPVLTAGINLHRTVEGRWGTLFSGPALRFVGFAAMAFLAATAVRVIGALLDPAGLLPTTWFVPGLDHLQFYGFFSMAMFGAIYALMPRLTGMEFPTPKLVRIHFWLAAAGIVILVISFVGAGIVEALKLPREKIAFIDVMKSTLPFLRASTIGDLLLAAGHLLFLANVVGLIVRFIRHRAEKVYALATADLWPAEVEL